MDYGEDVDKGFLDVSQVFDVVNPLFVDAKLAIFELSP